MITLFSDIVEMKYMYDKENRYKTKDLAIDISPYMKSYGDTQYMFEGLDSAVKDIFNLIDLYADQNIDIATLLSNYKLVTHRSLSTYVDYITNDVELAASSNQTWREFLIELPILKLLGRLVSLNRVSQKSITIYNALQSTVLNLEKSRFYHRCSDSATAKYMEDEVNMLMSKFETIDSNKKPLQ
jgi:hypothetical protein